MVTGPTAGRGGAPAAAAPNKAKFKKDTFTTISVSRDLRCCLNLTLKSVDDWYNGILQT